MAYHLSEAWRHLHLAFAIETPWAFWALVVSCCVLPGVAWRGVKQWADAFREETWAGRITVVVIGLFGLTILVLWAYAIVWLFRRVFG